MLNGPAASVAQNRQAASRVARLGGGAGPSPKPPAVDPGIDRVTALMHRALHRRLTLCELAVATSLSVLRERCHKSHGNIDILGVHRLRQPFGDQV